MELEKNARGNEHFALFVPCLRGGGAEKAFVNLACGLAERGHRVDLLLMERDGEYLSMIPSNIRIIDFADPSQSLKSVLPLVRYLRREKPHVLIAALKQSCMVALLAKALGAPSTRVITTLRGNLWQPDKRFRYRVGRAVLYRLANEIVAVSSGVADDFAKYSWLPRERMRVIYNGVNPERIAKLACEPVDHSWFADETIPVILAVGRLSKEKDYPTLIRAFAKVRSKRECRLMILGQGPERERLEDLVRELNLTNDVCFGGFQHNPYAFMARSSLLVLSSRAEGLPNVLIEAMTLGIPIASTDCESGPREILVDGKYGNLAQVGDFTSLASAIEQQLQSPTDKRLILQRARDFTLSRNIDAFVEVSGLPTAPVRASAGAEHDLAI